MPTSDLPTVGNSEVGISEGNLFELNWISRQVSDSPLLISVVLKPGYKTRSDYKVPTKNNEHGTLTYCLDFHTSNIYCWSDFSKTSAAESHDNCFYPRSIESFLPRLSRMFIDKHQCSSGCVVGRPMSRDINDIYIQSLAVYILWHWQYEPFDDGVSW